jgi:hypothetical protein
MQKVTQDQQKHDPTFSLIEPDRTHPTMQGQFFMAYLFLKAQGVPAEVAKLMMTGDGIVQQSINCQISQIKKTKTKLTFRYLANSLPFPIQPIEEWTSATTTWLPFVDDLNREIFQVTDLPSGIYQLTIDGRPIRMYSAAELTAGVNLAIETKTPQALQSQIIWQEYSKRQNLVFKLRTVACVERAAFTPELPSRLPLMKMEPLLTAYLKREVGTPWEKAITEEVAAYRNCKDDEDDIRLSVTSMMENIRSLCQPVPREITLTQLASE